MRREEAAERRKASNTCGPNKHKSSLTSVTIPKSVTSIGVSAFEECESLTSVTISSGVTSIGNRAFYKCWRLTSVTIPRGVTSIGEAAFYECEDLRSVTIQKSVTSIGNNAFYGCPLEIVYVQKWDEERVMQLLEDSGLWAGDIVFEISQSGSEVIAGVKSEVDVELIGYKATGLPKGLSYNAKTGKVTGTTKAAEGEYEVVFTKSGEEPVEMTFVVRAENEPAVDCDALEDGEFTMGVCGVAGGIPISISAESSVKSLTAKNLPTGMKIVQDKTTKEWRITGGATKAGTFNVVLTLTTVAGKKVEQNYTVNVSALPSSVVGVFNGFVKQDSDSATFGTIQVTTTDTGKITAKVVTAAKTYSFSASAWDEIADGQCRVELKLKSGETLALSVSSTSGWNDYQMSGSFEMKDTEYVVTAQKNAFGKMWYFIAEGNESDGWTLSYADNAKAANLTVALNADGKTSIAGKVGSVKISASWYADVSGVTDGAIMANFAPIVTINNKRMLLVILTNLWFDRSNDHEIIGWVGF